MTKAILYSILYAVFNVTGAGLIKWRLRGRTLSTLPEWMGFLFEPLVILAFVIIFISALSMFKALSSGQFTFVIPISAGINFMFTVLVGYFLFKDAITARSLLGFALILSGILLLSLNNARNAQG